MTADVRVARMALLILRDSRLTEECKHPAEALEHDAMRESYRCSACGMETADECVVRVLENSMAERSTTRPTGHGRVLVHTVRGRPLW